MAPEYEAGKLVAAQSGCLACHKIGENGNGGPGPELTDIGNVLPEAAIARTLENPTPPMPSYAELPEQKKADLVAFLGQLKGEGGDSESGGEHRRGWRALTRAHSRRGRSARCSIASRGSTTS